MGRRGPPKTPTALTLVKGNPGRRPLPKNEPQPAITRPEPPEHLSETARTEWRRICPLLADLGLMSDIDIAVLAAYCGAYSDLLDATEKQRGRSTVIKTVNGNWMQSPFVSMIRQARLDMIRFAAQLGMTPSARASMSINVPPAGLLGASQASQRAENPAQRYFGDDL